MPASPVIAAVRCAETWVGGLPWDKAQAAEHAAIKNGDFDIKFREIDAVENKPSSRFERFAARLIEP